MTDINNNLETAAHPEKLRRVAIEPVSRVEGHGKVTKEKSDIYFRDNVLGPALTGCGCLVVILVLWIFGFIPSCEKQGSNKIGTEPPATAPASE